ncbi:microcystin-dependent protein [Bradyrhizobium sp. AZCC 1588]|uniref:phage tail protein n=1 Tax=unclassified Bradyrhizobium TaxID=2631580 RepID=UPI002FF2A4C9
MHGFYGNPYNVPLAAGLDYWGPTTPNSAFAFPMGQAISRTTYASLFALVGTTYGSGDGSTTFNLPDKTGRVSAMKESSATRLTSTYFGGNSANLGAAGGMESVGLEPAKIPTLTASGANNISVISTVGGIASGMTNGDLLAHDNTSFGFYGPGKIGGGDTISLGQITSQGSNPISVTTQGTTATTGAAHNNVQPTIVCNYIIRII